MRILAIRGQNLASLARTFEVDLANGALGGAGLFAITGPVGAGKSTLLDAMCLALFDRTPRLSGHGGVVIADDGADPKDGIRANDPRMVLRRDAAAGHAETDFVGRDGVRYRARWSVRRARSASRRLQHQELLLTDLDRNVVVAGGVRTEVLAAIRARLGLDFDQFCRSVLLAQGEFASFLRARADERAKLLEALTGASIYRRLSRAAHERARDANAEAGKLHAQFHAQAPLVDDERTVLERQLAATEGEAKIAAVGAGLARRYVAWHEQAGRHLQRESEAAVALQRAQADETASSARRATLERRQRALAASGRYEVAHEEQVKAQRAATVARDAGVAAQQEQRALDAANEAFARAFVHELGAGDGGGGGDGGALASSPLLRDLPAWEPLLLQWQEAETRSAKVAASLPKHDAQLATMAQQLAAAKAELEPAALRHEHARQAVIVAERGAAVAPSAYPTAAEVAAADAAMVTAAARHDALRRQVDELQTRAGLAALRARLVAGEPCPLCGSDEHPAAGHDAGDSFAAARRELAEAAAEVERARRRSAVAAAAHEQAQREVARALQDALRAVADAAAGEQAAAMRVQHAEREADRHGAARNDLLREQSSLAARIDEARAALAHACAGGGDVLGRLGARRLSRVRSLHAAVLARDAARQRAAAASDAAATAQRDADAAHAAAARAAAALAHALEVANVSADDVANALAAGSQGLTAEAEALQRLATEVTRCRTILQERAQERREHEGRDRPTLDLDDAVRALRDAQASEAAAAERLGRLIAKRTEDDAIRRHRDEIAPRLAAAEDTQRTWGALDELIGSSTGDSFAVFAQGLTLDLLLDEANHRLGELARRYRLHRNPGGELDFAVVDLDLGGARRSLATLSGGETFLVSLALALALATLAAPKSRVETLFLDEGFGTLDAPSLEIALGALDSLQATGCQVGIISHVDGIAERIGAQVVVQPEGAGQSRVFACER